MIVAWDLGYRELVRGFAARGSSFVGRASGKQEAILDLFPRAEPEKGSRVRCHRRHVDGAHRVYGISRPDDPLAHQRLNARADLPRRLKVILRGCVD